MSPPLMNVLHYSTSDTITRLKYTIGLAIDFRASIIGTVKCYIVPALNGIMFNFYLRLPHMLFVKYSRYAVGRP